MSPQLFLIAFLLGTAALALWIDARFPGLAPADLSHAMARAGVAMAVGWLLFPRLWDAVSSASIGRASPAADATARSSVSAAGG